MLSNHVVFNTPPWGCIKQSRAEDHFDFAGVTRGIAIKYVSRGAECYRLDDRQIIVNRAEFILLPPDQPYRVLNLPANTSGRVTDGTCIDINPRQLRQIASELGPTADFYGLPLRCRYSSQLGQTLSTWPPSTHLETGCDLLDRLSNNLTLLLLELMALQDTLRGVTKRLGTLKELTIKLIAAREFVHHHFREKIQLEDLSRTCGLSKFHLQRLFRYGFSQSPLAMQHQLRMLEAHRQIRADRRSLTQIAMDLGYTDLPAFSRQFTRYWGVTPSRVED